MKTLSNNISTIILTAFLVCGMSYSASAQTSKKADQVITMQVPGVCGNCKERIESTALDVKGVKKAEWDLQSESLVLVGSSKMKREKVGAALAKAGYRSEVCAADANAYNKLPGCCQYDSGLEKH